MPRLALFPAVFRVMALLATGLVALIWSRAAVAIDRSGVEAWECVPEEPVPPPPPPECDQLIQIDNDVNRCGCFYIEDVMGTPYIPCMPSHNINGSVCSGRAHFSANDDGLQFVSVFADEGQISVTVPTTAEVMGNGQPMAESLFASMTLSETQGEGRAWVPPIGVSQLTAAIPTGTAKYVGADELDSDLAGGVYTSLTVEGIYFALSDVTVTGDCDIRGMVYIRGSLTCGDLTVTGTVAGPLRVGGMLFAGPIEADSLDASHAYVYTRDIWMETGGSLVVEGTVTAEDSVIEAGEGLVAGEVSAGTFSSLSLTVDTVLRAREIHAGPIRLEESRLVRVSLLNTSDLHATWSTIQAGASLTVDATGAVEFLSTQVASGGDVFLDAESMVLDAESEIDAAAAEPTELSLESAQEPQDTALSLFQVPGPSYGGWGGTQASLTQNTFRPAAAPQGDPRSPIGPGVHGWSMPWNEHTAGGGEGREVALTIRGSLVLDGTIRANGGNAPGSELGGGGSGGTGGTIRASAESLDGHGILFANGGEGTTQLEGNDIGQCAGGGSGGRIAIRATHFGDVDLSFESIGGLGGQIHGETEFEVIRWNDWRAHGGPGTFYLVEGGEAGLLVIDGHGLSPSSACPSLAPDCRGVAWLPADLGDTDVVIRNTVVTSGGLRARSLTLENAILRPDNTRTRLDWPIPELDYEGIDFTAAQGYYPMSVWTDPVDESVTIELTEDLFVAADARIELTGYGGYSRAEWGEDAICWAGGSHGGVGGIGDGGTGMELPSTPAFGDPKRPTTVGQGGCSESEFTGEPHAQCGLGGGGGGALRVIAGGVVDVEGALLVNGGDGKQELEGIYCVAQQGTAGGAGGSIWITAQALRGDGVLSAAGGDGKRGLDVLPCGGGGGGGRIAVYGETRDWEGELDVSGGSGCDLSPETASEFLGGDGSVWVEPPPEDGGCRCTAMPGQSDRTVSGLLLLAALATIRRRPAT